MTEQVDRIRAIIQRRENSYAIHYGCQGILNVGDRLPQIGCIIVKSLIDDEFRVFRRTSGEGEASDEASELQMLSDFNTFLADSRGAKFIHWNMSKPNYGFGAIGSRFEQLSHGASSNAISAANCINLDVTFKEAHGDDYAQNPRLRHCAEMNGLPQRYALSGEEEVRIFAAGDFNAMEMSVSEKVDWIRALAHRAAEDGVVTLRTIEAVSFGGRVIDASGIVIQTARRLLLVQRALGRRERRRPAPTFVDEYDDQYLMGSLLRIFFDDVRPEEWTPSYAGSSSRIDFVLNDFGLAIELKHTRSTLTDRELGEELIVDTVKYGAHDGIRHLICVVFDHDGHLTNPRGIERDLGRNREQSGLTVTVVIIDR
jgi:hypothetical protein